MFRFSQNCQMFTLHTTFFPFKIGATVFMMTVSVYAIFSKFISFSCIYISFILIIIVAEVFQFQLIYNRVTFIFSQNGQGFNLHISFPPLNLSANSLMINVSVYYLCVFIIQFSLPAAIFVSIEFIIVPEVYQCHWMT